MGDPKKFRKKYATPVHPWNEKAIVEERELKKEYGIRIKKEIYRSATFLKKYKNIAKRLIAVKNAQNEKETEQVLGKLHALGLLPAGATLDQILNLTIKDILERRLQSIVYRKGLARSMNQARQFIVHRHILVNGKEITFPSYLTTLEEEATITFKPKSALASEDHPERIDPRKMVEEEKAKIADSAVKEEPEAKVEEKKAEKEKEAPKTEEKQEAAAEPAPESTETQEETTETPNEEPTKETAEEEKPVEVAQ